MKKTLMLLLFVLAIATTNNAQTPVKTTSAPDWRVNLVAEVVKKFSVTEDEADRAVTIKQNTSNSIAVLLRPEQTSKGMQRDDKAIEEVKQKEQKDFLALFKNEVKANQISTYLQAGIPNLIGAGGRRR